MNEKEGPPNPDNKRRIRPEAAPGGLMPTRASRESSDTTGGDASKAETNAGLEATIGMAPTVGPDAGAAASRAEAGQAAGTAISPGPKSQATQAGQVIANRFVVKQMLGQGGMGRVYAVQDRQIEGRDVALKVLLPKYSKNEQFRKLFFQEVRAAQEFVSEYICQVRDTGETEEGNLFFTMDRIEGEALRALLDREKVLGARQALEITRQVLLGLNSGHEKGYVHRDIKPSNVMLAASVPKTDTNPYGVGVRLLDFGIAGLASKLDERSRAGTVMYMSPEQASGERLDPRSDLFAVGVLLFEMISGHRPFDGSTTRALVQSVLETNLTARLGEIPNLSKQLRKLLERALQKDRSKRFQSATDFANEIAKSEAYKLPKEVPGWAYSGLGVLVLVAAAEGYKLNQLSGDLVVSGAKVASAQSEKTAAVLEAQRLAGIEFKTKSDSYDALRDAHTATTTELTEAKATIADLKLAQKSEVTDSGQDETTNAGFVEQLRNANLEIARISTELSQVREKAEAAEGRADAAEALNKTAVRDATPPALCASTFDSVCKLIRADLGYQALTELKKAQQGKEATFATAGSDGADTIVALAKAADRVYVYRESVRSDTQVGLGAMVEAAKFLDIAEKGASTLAVEGASWVDFKFQEQEVPDRPKLLRELSEVLRSEVTKALASSEEADLADFSAIDLALVSRDAKAIFAHRDRFACSNHLSKAAELLVDQLRKEAAAGNVLQYEKLRGFTTLPEFVLRLNQGQFTIDDAKNADLQAFQFAQRWYADDAGDPTIDWKFARPPVPTAPTKDWRQVMYLQWQLSQENANFPIKKNRSQLHRLQGPNKKLNWAVGVSQNDSRTEILVETFDAEGMFPEGTKEKFKFEFIGGALRVQGTSVTIVNLHAWGDGLSVVPFPSVVLEPAVPEALATAGELRKFREYVKATPLACLVVVDPKSSRTRWLSPEFGLVFDDTPGTLKRELVFVTGVQ